YGHTGPLKDRPGYDPLMQAHGGIMSITGVEGGEPVRVGCSIVDQGAGMWAAMGIVAAGNDNLFRALCGALERDFATEARFETNSKRVENRRTLIPMLEEIFRT